MRSSLFLRVCTVALLLALPGLLGAEEVLRFRMADTVQPASRKYIERVLEDADSRGSSLVVMELDTPGGLISSSREITTAITSSKVPVAVYVSPAGARAASAGFFILMSADIAAMAPGTNTGAAHPVGGHGEDLGEHMNTKVTNDAQAMIRSLAERRGRNIEKSVEIVEKSSSFTASEALELNLVDVVADDFDGLMKQLDGREITRFDGSKVKLNLDDVVVSEEEPSSAERFLSILANPNIAYLLMALGMLGIYVEITHPGAVLPGVVGVIAILLGLYSTSVLPVNITGVALIIVGLALFLLEVKVASYGLLTVGGLISFVLGSMMLFDSPVPDLRVSLGVILPTALLVAIVTVFLLNRVIKTHRTRPVTGVEGLVGEEGKVILPLNPRGKVLIHGEYWDAWSRGLNFEKGATVRVSKVDGSRLIVEAPERDTATQSIENREGGE